MTPRLRLVAVVARLAALGAVVAAFSLAAGCSKTRQFRPDQLGNPLVLLARLDGHSGAVLACDIHADASLAISGGADRTLRVWDLAHPGGRLLRTLRGHNDMITTVALSDDGRRAVSGSYDGTMRVWDLDAGNLVATIDVLDGWVLDVGLLPGGDIAYACGADHRIQLHDLRKPAGQTLITIYNEEGLDEFTLAEASPNGQRMLLDGGAQALFTLSTGNPLRMPTDNSTPVSDLRFSPDGTKTVTAVADVVAVHTVADHEPLAFFIANDETTTSAAFCLGDQRVLAGYRDGAMRLWDVRQPDKPVMTVPAHADALHDVAVSGDGAFAVSAGGDGSLRFWAIAQWAPIDD